MHRRHLLLTAALSLAAASAAHATVAPLSAGSGWSTFDVADIIANDGGLGWIDIGDGSALGFQFVVPSGFSGRLTVVDGGFSGDAFSVIANGLLLGTTSAPVNSLATNVGLDFDAALANPDFSRGVFTLAAGTYLLTGALTTSAFDASGALNSTVGAVRLEVSPVPAPPALATILAGLGALGFVVRRRSK